MSFLYDKLLIWIKKRMWTDSDVRYLLIEKRKKSFSALNVCCFKVIIQIGNFSLAEYLSRTTAISSVSKI